MQQYSEESDKFYWEMTHQQVLGDRYSLAPGDIFLYKNPNDTVILLILAMERVQVQECLNLTDWKIHVFSPKTGTKWMNVVVIVNDGEARFKYGQQTIKKLQ